jgi:hypothetical protein
LSATVFNSLLRYKAVSLKKLESINRYSEIWCVIIYVIFNTGCNSVSKMVSPRSVSDFGFFFF